MAKNKAYVVFAGHSPGVYTDWEDVLDETKGFSGAVYKGYQTLEEAKAAYRNGMLAAPKMGVNSPNYKQTNSSMSNGSATGTGGSAQGKHIGDANAGTKPTSGPKLRPLADDPKGGAKSVQGSGPSELKSVSPAKLALLKGFDINSWSVDAACSGNPGPMEYRGVDNRTGQELFRIGPVRGTNNIGEFLAIVHALAFQQKLGVSIPIYSDSVNAMGWVKAKNARTKLPNTANTKIVWELINRATTWLQNNNYNTKILKWDTTKWGENPADFGRK